MLLYAVNLSVLKRSSVKSFFGEVLSNLTTLRIFKIRFLNNSLTI